MHSRVGLRIPAPRQTVTVPRRTTLDLEGQTSCSRGTVELRFTPPTTRSTVRTRARRCACWPACSPRRPSRPSCAGTRACNVRPMERVADPLRAMGADVRTTDGHPPIVVRGGRLRGIEHRTEVPSAQVKSAVLLAGLAAEGSTTVREPAPTRDHTERALAALGAPVAFEPGLASVRAFEHEGFAAAVPGDVSSAAFLVGAAVLTGAALAIEGVGLNPTRTRFLEVLGTHGRVARISDRTRGARRARRNPRGRAGAAARRDDDRRRRAPAGDRRGAGPGDRRRARERRDAVPGRRRAPAQGERPAGRARGGDPGARGSGGARGRRPDRGWWRAGRRGGGRPRGPSDGDGAGRGCARGAGARSRSEGIEAAEVSFPGFERLLVSLGARIEVSA